MESKIKLSAYDAEELWCEIESEGLGYWVQHYGYKKNKDEELAALCREAKTAMRKLDNYINNIFEHYDIG
jgi:hypothetical protein